SEDFLSVRLTLSAWLFQLNWQFREPEMLEPQMLLIADFAQVEDGSEQTHPSHHTSRYRPEVDNIFRLQRNGAMYLYLLPGYCELLLWQHCVRQYSDCYRVLNTLYILHCFE